MSPSTVFSSVDLPEPLEPTRRQRLTRQQRQGDVVDDDFDAVADRQAGGDDDG